MVKQDGASNTIRGFFAGGSDPAITNIIDYITIASTGNAADFGDLTYDRSMHGGNSNGHGGLQYNGNLGYKRTKRYCKSE